MLAVATLKLRRRDLAREQGELWAVRCCTECNSTWTHSKYKLMMSRDIERLQREIAARGILAPIWL
ncbi:hypothetical protein BGZ61DRAFT_469868, partial [Ilyonectria robusta]|uniref:uncharacterized protein n=1 Tax=Ilyonectria robusta TaxID=1079257 RepID=UPI001E8E9F56